MRGFTLVEVLVALMMLEVGVLGVVGTLVLASRALGEAERIERAVVEVDRVADSLASAGFSTPGTATIPGGRISWDTGPGGLETIVTAIAAAGDTLVRVLIPDRP